MCEDIYILIFSCYKVVFSFWNGPTTAVLNQDRKLYSSQVLLTKYFYFKTCHVILNADVIHEYDSFSPYMTPASLHKDMRRLQVLSHLKVRTKVRTQVHVFATRSTFDLIGFAFTTSS